MKSKLIIIFALFIVKSQAQNVLPNCGGLYLCEDELVKFAKDFLAFPPSDCKLWDGACGFDNEITRKGKVTIGSSGFMISGYQLGVKGGIISEQLKICKQEWCDYVFEDSFQLLLLPDLALYLKQYGHLPDCTSAAVIKEEQGITVEREIVNQQKKIEEIYLHLVSLNERMGLLSGTANAFLGECEKEQTQVYSPVQTRVNQKIDSGLTESVLIINCFQINPATIGLASGSAGVIVDGGQGVVNVTCKNLGTNATQTVLNSSCTETIKFAGLTGGTYQITVTGGGDIETCTFVIEAYTASAADFCNPLNSSSCQFDIVGFLQETIKPGQCDQWDGNNCSLGQGSKIFRTGNVCIGTTNSQSGFSLAVKGGIITDDFKIELCETEGWCDYVFDEKYTLMSLPEVNQYIKGEKHLPGMTSQMQILNDGGYEVKKVKMEQQVKIEEAFLYLIELEKKKEQINKQLSEY